MSGSAPFHCYPDLQSQDRVVLLSRVSFVFIMLVTQSLFTVIVKNEARYMPSNNSFLGSKPRCYEGAGTLTFSALAFNVNLHGSVLLALGLGSKFTTTSLFITIWQEQ